MKAKFEKNFWFDTEYSVFKSKITLQLPAVAGALKSELQSKNMEVFGELLNPHWGAAVEDMRQKRLELVDKDITTLVEKVENKIAETVKTLMEIKEKNLTAIKAVPPTTIYETEI